ncbi:hypothetical protein TruAng_006313 [Truncatella angustata]|nr:hypothetical protein TruAng_006313 [Truncatella angustata]
MDFQSRYTRLTEEHEPKTRLRTPPPAHSYEMTGGLSNPSSSDLEVVGADRSETPINARDKFVVRPYSPNGIQSAYVPDASVPAPERYAGVDRPRRRWLEGLKKRRVYIESAFASLVVIGIVVGVVYGTERQRHASDSRMTDDSQPSNSTVPIGKSFNASFGVPAGNCTYTCGSSVSVRPVVFPLIPEQSTIPLPFNFGSQLRLDFA